MFGGGQTKHVRLAGCPTAKTAASHVTSDARWPTAACTLQDNAAGEVWTGGGGHHAA